MDGRGDDRTVRAGIDAAERWATFTHDFGSIRRLGRAAAPPLAGRPSDASEMNSPANTFDVAVKSIHTCTAALECDLNRALATRVIDKPRFFGVPVPADI